MGERGEEREKGEVHLGNEGARGKGREEIRD